MHGTISPFQWTEARVADLKAKIDARWSASEVAALYGISRSAAIGKANREGLSFDSTHPGNYKEYLRRPKPKPATAVVKQKNNIPFDLKADLVPPLNIPFLKRKLDQCAYLYGDEPSEMTCCGHPTYGTGSWCLAHAQLVVVPFQARNREPRPR